MAGDEEKAEEEKDTELDLIAEQELLRLMRQFRVKIFAKYDSLLTTYLNFFSNLKMKCAICIFYAVCILGTGRR